MSKLRLKKLLKELDAEQIQNLVIDLYDILPDAKSYLEFWQDPDPEKALASAKLKINRLFFIKDERPRAKVSQTLLKNELQYFEKICMENDLIAELRLYTFECRIDWITSRSKEKNATKWEKDLLTTKEYIEKSDNADVLAKRFNSAVRVMDAYFDTDFQMMPRYSKRYIKFTKLRTDLNSK